MSESCLFCGIATGAIPARVAHRDAELVAFHDIAPQAPVHLLIIPTRHLDSLAVTEAADEGLLGRMVARAVTLARELALDRGYRLVLNCGEDGGQSVGHLHLHLLGGRSLGWPPG